MAKKTFFLIGLALFLISIFSTVSFAKTDNTIMTNITTELGDEVTSSMNKTERSMEDLIEKTNLDKVGRTNENRAVAGETRDYEAGQVQQQQVEETSNRNGMTQNAWIWIVMAVIALVIIATVWFYAAQRRD